MGALNTTLYRLRRQTGMAGVIDLHDGRLSINRKRCVVDRWVVESALDAATALIELKAHDADPQVLAALLGVVISHYRGPLLETDDSYSVETARSQLRVQVLQLLERADLWLRNIDANTTNWMARLRVNHSLPTQPSSA